MLVKGTVNISMVSTSTQYYVAGCHGLPSDKERYSNQLHKRVKTEGESKYLKCISVGCDGSESSSTISSF